MNWLLLLGAFCIWMTNVSIITNKSISFNIGVNPSNHVNLNNFLKLLSTKLGDCRLLTVLKSGGKGQRNEYKVSNDFKKEVAWYKKAAAEMVSITDNDYVEESLDNGYYATGEFNNPGPVHSWQALTTMTTAFGFNFQQVTLRNPYADVNTTTSQRLQLYEFSNASNKHANIIY